MQNYIVVNTLKNWNFDIPGVSVITAKEYLFSGEYLNRKGTKIFNLCKSYRYQSMGYYVSLLAVARGHKAFPKVSTIQEMKAPHVIRVIAEELDSLVQKSLSHIQSGNFVLSIYFGRNLSPRYDRLSREIYKLFQAPLLRVFFYKKNTRWKIQNIQLISGNDIPDEHREYVLEFARSYFSRDIQYIKRKAPAPYDMAILVNSSEKTPPSDSKAMEKFVKCGEKAGFNVDLIEKDSLRDIAEYDALFIRETTGVNHHTFRFAQRAQAEGLVVIDDPQSIIKCTNKVYLAEMMGRYKIPTPKTLVFSSDNMKMAADGLPFPMILKQPDSSYSQGVVKVESKAEFRKTAGELFDRSDLLIAQEFMRTDFDWRIGIIDRKPLYACKYFMAANHWQILNWEKKGKNHAGRGETVPVEDVPSRVIQTALKAANCIGDGIYGVDLKVSGGKCYVIEVNDNPSLDYGVEDRVLKDELYMSIMKVFYERVRSRKEKEHLRIAK